MLRRWSVCCALTIAAGFLLSTAQTAGAVTRPAGGGTASTQPARGMLAVAQHQASTGGYGATLMAGCAWATWVHNCGNLSVYGNGGSFDDNGCGPPNGCTFGSEFQCNELAQRYAYYAWGEPASWNGYGGNQGSAYQMWNAGPALPVPLAQFANGGGMPPQVGDLMIFNQGWLGSYWDGAGHVAVVSAVNQASSTVRVAEQNATASGSDQFSLSGSTVTANGYTPVMGWLRPQELSGPVDLTGQLGGGASVYSAPQGLVTPDGAQHAFWQGIDRHLVEAVYSGGVWRGGNDWTAQAGYPGAADLVSRPTVVVVPGTTDVIAVWQGADGHIWQATSTAGNPGPATDVSAALHAPAAGNAQSPPSVALNRGQELVFWRGANDALWEAWANGSQWAGVRNWTDALGAPAGGGVASAPTVLIAPGGYQQLVYWQGANSHLWEAWWTAGRGWAGPVDWSGSLHAPGSADLAATPAVLFTPGGGQQLVYWQGTNGDLWEAWWGAGGWSGPADWSAALGAPPDAHLISAPTVTVTPDARQQLVFWRGSNDHLWEAVYGASGWAAPRDLSRQQGMPATSRLLTQPSVAFTPGGYQQLVFWTSSGHDLEEAWHGGGTWSGPSDLSAEMQNVSFSPVVATAGGQQLVFWRSANGHLHEAWFAAGAWAGPADLTSNLGGTAASLLVASPAAQVVAGAQVVTWQGAGGDPWSAWFVSGRWHGPVDLRTALGLPAGAGASGAPGLAAGAGSSLTALWRGSNQDVWAASFAGAGWTGGSDVTPGLGAAGNGPATVPTGALVQYQALPLVAWQSAGGDLWAAMPSGAGWTAPQDLSSQLQAPAASRLAGTPVAVYSFGQQLVFWQGTNGDVWEAWYGSGSWSGPADISSQLPGSGSGTAQSTPAVAVGQQGQQYVYWRGSDAHLHEAWYAGSWLGPWDWSATLNAPNQGAVSTTPAVAIAGGQSLVFWASPSGHLWEAWQNRTG